MRDHTITTLNKHKKTCESYPAAADTVSKVNATNGMLDALIPQRHDKLRPEASRAGHAKQSQDEIPCDERMAQVVLLARLHEHLAEENGHNVEGGVEEAQRPILIHPYLLVDHVVRIEELGLVVEQERVVYAALGEVETAKVIAIVQVSVHYINVCQSLSLSV
jgi:hypothetical protein